MTLTITFKSLNSLLFYSFAHIIFHWLKSVLTLVLVLTFAMLLVILPRSLVDSPAFEEVLSIAFFFSIHEMAIISGSSFEEELSLTMVFVIKPFSMVLIAVLIVHCSLTILLAIFELA